MEEFLTNFEYRAGGAHVCSGASC